MFDANCLFILYGKGGGTRPLLSPRICGTPPVTASPNHASPVTASHLGRIGPPPPGERIQHTETEGAYGRVVEGERTRTLMRNN